MQNLNNIKITRAVAEDALGIQTLTAEASKGMFALCGWSEEEIAKHFTPEVIKDGAERLEKSIPTFTDADILFVAKDEGGKIVGFCFAERQENINRIEAVYIDPEFQGIGLGGKLYEEAFKYLNSAHDTYLEVFTANSKAIVFYKKLGFVETGKKVLDERFLNAEGEILPGVEMVLQGK